ncbi:TPA: hypothetical protein WGR75_002031 [Neisseria meningitidis]|uniref:hypothetical protein n=1 Tax=Neisseria meningitidis TaxID=487 RepID=UPI000FCCB8A7|nr:hypothetical protein [Neisseria meningitidis]MCL4979292.1 hypothetical protein [Neisseria meningitidis]MCL4999352.1 hypothetical protein [Neisseria meningitidis]MCL5764427.1 hypothetical protein [Neisseria meningitidis]MCL5865367.1 hypothetical protein [Neisseria meningitidis]MCL5917213.1 hypothetical protein [Neisseria meningitidis]
MFKKFKLVLLSFFALVFAFWLGTGIAYEINPRWFLSDTATENPNAFVAKLARLFRNADRAVVIVKESMRTEESLAGAVDDGPLQSEKDYLALAVRLSRLKEKAKWFHVTEQEHGEEVWLDYYIGEGGLVAVSLSQRSPEAFVNAEYLYRNDRPFSVNVYGGTAHGENYETTGEYRVVWQPDGSVFDASGRGKIGEDVYEHCLGCYQMAQVYLAKYRDVANDEQKVWDFREESNRIASDSHNSVFYQNMQELMPRGMKANSLVVGYDADGLPQKVYWSFDNGKKRQSFEYYLKNGNLFIAQSSTVALKADGVTADIQTYHAQQTWYLDGGRIIREEKQGDKLPDFPLNLEDLEKEVSRYAEAAARRSGGRRDLSH